MRHVAAKADDAASATLLRLVRPDESEAVHHVHLAVRRTLLDRRFMYEHGRDFFRDVASGGGRLVGAYRDDELIGYLAFHFGQETHSSHWRHLHHLSVPAGEIAEGAGGGILQQSRRRGLFTRLLRKRYDVARELGLKFQTSIVAPDNIACLRSLLEEGCLIAARYEDQDGDNYLLLKSLVGRVPLHELPGCPVALDDVASNLRFLRSGFCGVPCGNGEALRVRYVRAVALPTSSNP